MLAGKQARAKKVIRHSMASGPAFRYIKCMHGAEVLVNGSAGQVSDCMTESHVSGLKEAMSLPEKLLKSAKVGNSRDVRKLLGRGVPITKDKVLNIANFAQTVN